VKHHLAQVNVAYMRAPQDDPLLADFVARLDEINALAEQSPGFVWRYISDSRDPTSREYDDPMVLFNMSVWDSVEALHAFTYKTAHAEVFAKRAKWFDDAMRMMASRQMALWWIPEGTRPTASDAKTRLAHITAHGPSAFAFTFKQSFAPDGREIVRGNAPVQAMATGQ
jgi:heme-degrading monooxygenase HmoA